MKEAEAASSKEAALLSLRDKAKAVMLTKQSRIDELEATVKSLEQEVASLRTSTEQAEAEANVRVGGEAALAAQVHRAEELEVSLAASQSRVEELEGCVLERDEAVSTLERRITELEGTWAAQVAAERTSSEAVVALKQSEVEELGQSLTKLRESLEEETLRREQALQQLLIQLLRYLLRVFFRNTMAYNCR